MLDVHPPHHAAHSWRDFFIHIATIVVGLLIAVGLEQTVEALHHHHQRREILEQLDAEHRQVVKDATADIAENELMLNWEAAHIEALQAVLTQHRPYIVPPRPALSPSNVAQDPVWLSVKASGLTGLLPQAVVVANSEPEVLLKEMEEQITESHRVQTTLMIPACGRLPLLPGSDTTDYTHADVHDLRDCLAATMSYYSVRRGVRNLQVFILGAEKAILDGETDIDRISDREAKELEATRARVRPVAIPR